MKSYALILALGTLPSVPGFAAEKVQANLKELHSNSPVAGDLKDANAVTVVGFFDYRCG